MSGLMVGQPFSLTVPRPIYDTPNTQQGMVVATMNPGDLLVVMGTLATPEGVWVEVPTGWTTDMSGSPIQGTGWVLAPNDESGGTVVPLDVLPSTPTPITDLWSSGASSIWNSVTSAISAPGGGLIIAALVGVGWLLLSSRSPTIVIKRNPFHHVHEDRPCECEHESHFEHDAWVIRKDRHPFRWKVPARAAVKTTYGTFRLCPPCIEQGHMGTQAENISRQRAWQIRQKADDRCEVCGKKGACAKHIMEKRLAARRRSGSKAYRPGRRGRPPHPLRVPNRNRSIP